MAIGMHGSQALTSLLRVIFEEATLRVSLAGLTEQERRRNIAFYDEVITVAVRLSVPASKRTVPAPIAQDRQTSWHFPLEIRDDGDDDEEDEESDEARYPPRIFALLVACLRVSLEAAYVPPRLARGTALSTTEGDEKSSHVFASIVDEDEAYQAVRLQAGSNDAATEATRMVYKEWSGNTTPPRPDLKKPASGKGQEAWSTRKKTPDGADAWYSPDEGGHPSWIVEWRCEVPIVFLRSRHPTPALILNSVVSLHIQPSRLSHLAPSLAAPTTTSASDAVFFHDLLNPLSEGPSYPDESPAERAARADASLAKLPLGKLPSSILGSKLVTPARAAREVGRIVEQGKRLTLQNGDMGDVEEWNSLKQGKRDLTEEGLLGRSKTDASVEQGLGEDSIVVHRSARRVLDVRTAVQVRMRTTNIAGVGEGFGEASSSDDDLDDGESTVPTLILCVEIENPTNSGIKFALDDVGVQVAVPSESYGTLHPTSRVHVDAKPIGYVPNDLIIEQGSQYNVLYRVDFNMPFQGRQAMETSDLTTFMTETQRTITIELYGRPVLLQQDENRRTSDYSPGENFTSTWSCTLDFATQIQSLILARVIAEGAGGFTLGKTRDENAEIALHNVSGDRSAVPPSVVAQRRMDSLRSLQPSSTSAPLRIASANLSAASGPKLSGRVPSSALAPDSLIALQRSPDGREPDGGDDPFASQASGPAMPSSMVGPSILARARRNRMATMGSLPSTSQHDSIGEGTRRAATLVMSSEQKHGHAREPSIPGRVSSSSWHVQNALSGSHLIDVHSALPVLPMGSKGTWARLPFLLQGAGTEQGLLVDVVASAQKESDERCTVEVQLQIDNRSKTTRTLLLQWKRSIPPNSQTSKSDALDTTRWMPEDDAVQVGPIVAGQAEVAMMRLETYVSSMDEDLARSIPPLILTDVESGMQRTLTCVQPFLV